MATIHSNAGKAICSGRMIGASPSQAEAKYIGWGTGAGTAAVADTTLFTETGTRTTGTGAQATTTLTNDTYRVTGTITAVGTITVTNAGTFDASSSGNLAVKGDFTGIALVINESIAFTIDTKFA